MGFSTLIDILGSTIIGGMLLMILLRLNGRITILIMLRASRAEDIGLGLQLLTNLEFHLYLFGKKESFRAIRWRFPMLWNMAKPPSKCIKVI